MTTGRSFLIIVGTILETQRGIGYLRRRVSMPRIRCASIDCKWNSDTNMCNYGRTGHTLLIGDTYTHTVNDGVQHFHRCKGYEKSEEAAKLESEFLKFLKETGNEY